MQLKKHIRRRSRKSRIAAARVWLNRNPADAQALALIAQLKGNQHEQ